MSLFKIQKNKDPCIPQETQVTRYFGPKTFTKKAYSDQKSSQLSQPNPPFSFFKQFSSQRQNKETQNESSPKHITSFQVLSHNQRISQIWKDQYSFFQKNQNLYSYDIDLKSHNQLNNKLRGILIDWIQQVCMELSFTRETYHLSLYYIDKYLENHPDFDKTLFQLLGITAIEIAQKIEEVVPMTIKKLVQTTDGTYNIQQMIKMEQKIIKTLNFHLRPVTNQTIANFILYYWDSFQSEHQSSFFYLPLFFKQNSQTSYKAFRSYFQILDLMMMDMAIYSFDRYDIMFSILYLTVGIRLNQGFILMFLALRLFKNRMMICYLQIQNTILSLMFFLKALKYLVQTKYRAVFHFVKDILYLILLMNFHVPSKTRNYKRWKQFLELDLS